MIIAFANTGARVELLRKEGQVVIAPSEDFDYDDPRNSKSLHSLCAMVKSGSLQVPMSKEGIVAIPGGATQQQMETQAPTAQAAPQLVSMEQFQLVQQEVARLTRLVEQLMTGQQAPVQSAQPLPAAAPQPAVPQPALQPAPQPAPQQPVSPLVG